MSFPAVSSSVSSRCSTCGTKVNPRWPACIACRRALQTQPPDAIGAHPDVLLEQTPPEQTPTPDVDTILGMPLAEFGAKHLALRVRLPDGSSCHFVSGADEIAVLRGDGIPRGVIWTAKELADVIGTGWTSETIGRLIAVRREFPDARVVTPDDPGPVLRGREGGTP